jgi:hypothetical protein
MAAEQGGYFGLDRLRQQRSRPVAQNLGQWIGECPWLGELENISLGVSLLRWRSGGFETPPRYAASIPHAVTTFANSSAQFRLLVAGGNKAVEERPLLLSAGSALLAQFEVACVFDGTAFDFRRRNQD